MSVSPRPAPSAPRVDREVAAFGLFAFAEQATWTALLVVAYSSGGVTTAGVVSAVALFPAALGAPWVAFWMPRLTDCPVPRGYLAQAVSMVVCGACVVLEASIVVVSIAAAAMTMALTSSRPMHQSSLARRRVPSERLRATTASGAADGAAKFLGPIAAAASMVLLGKASVFILGAGCLLLAAVFTRDVASRRSDLSESPPGFWSTTLLVGRCRGVLAVLFALASATVLLGVVETVSTEMADVRMWSGESATGILLAAFGAGLVLGGLTAAASLRRARAHGVLIAGGLVSALGLAACGVAGGPWSTGGALLLTGVGLQTMQVAGWVLLHVLVPMTATAHVFALLESHQLVGNMIGAALAGATVSRIGVAPVVVWSAVALGVVATVAATRVRPPRPVASGGLDDALEAA